jgi:hypothetical protein
MYLRKSEYELSDGIFGLGRDQKKGTFYSVERSEYDFSHEYENFLFIATIFVDSTQNFYERKVYNVFDFTGQIGGLYEILAIFGSIFVAFFSEKILMLSLISDLYQVEDKRDTLDFSPLDRKHETLKVMPKNPQIEEKKTPDVSSRNKSMAKLEDSQVNESFIDSDAHANNIELLPLNQEMTEVQQEHMAVKLRTVIKRRRNYNYKLIDLVCAYIPSFKCK